MEKRSGPAGLPCTPLTSTGYPAAMVGYYEGRVVAAWLRDGRNMQIQEPFAYVDAATLRWDVPAQARVDGASILDFFGRW